MCIRLRKLPVSSGSSPAGLAFLDGSNSKTVVVEWWDGREWQQVPLVEATPLEYHITLLSIGPNKVGVIKAIREITGLGLKEAKDIVDFGPGAIIARTEDQRTADRMVNTLEKVGALVRVSLS